MADANSPTTSPPSDSSQSPPPPSPDNSNNSSPPPAGDNSSPPPSLSPPPSSPPPSSPPPSSPSPPPPSQSSPSPPPPSQSSPSPPPPSGSSPSPPSPPPPPSPQGETPSPPNRQDFSPPPPPHPRLSPPKSSHSHNNNNSNENNENQFSTGAIIGIASGAGLLLLVLSILLIVCSRRKKRSPQPHLQFYNHHQSHGPNQYEYNNRDHVLNIPPPPGGGGGGGGWGPPPPRGGGGGGWGPPPPPGGGGGWGLQPANSLPPQHLSSDMSTSSFSGSQGPVLPPPHPTVALGFNQSSFTFDELSVATGAFAHQNLLGQGGFGYVHKGVLPNGKEIAVKSLKATSGQGDREFQAEVDTISRVHHRYLVSLVGYCISDAKKLLVYEFVPNKTLEYHLHGKGRPVMDWSTRLKIALGSAKGLAYLHEDCHPRIIHRDIKGANILLENNFEAKVADFGLAKFNQDANTHVSTRVMGTFGYMAPEYASSGKLTDKSDVFSYGVMLLELITGRRPVGTSGDYEEDSLVDWARPLCNKALENGILTGLVDIRLEDNYDKNELTRMIACAATSVRHSAKRRPKMSQIVRVLEGDSSLEALHQDGVKAGNSTMYSSASGDYDAGAYSADMKKFKKLALESGVASSDYGGTSEYGLNLSISTSEQSSSDYSKRTATGTGSRINTP
ncbi:proline-rich receptor-like protein kinase PERK4 [Lathyrus oleraceus]|uniref:non-specific serine/threonine protein kinase n=1 Tax=Pisum sativum TaxID=3888 RepID=A0A9D4WGT2_PEA|nr:proline-rich receptor-like protein kinase PERK4 [Pisum sativum]KAI5402493.1 Proline-rich receptor-like protein kinase perk5 [Pisum sativum]